MDHETPGWCRNLVEAGRLRPDEEVLVVVDEPLAEQGSQLTAALKEAGGRPHLELWAGERPLAHAPPSVLEVAGRATLAYSLAQAPRPDEAGARFEILETMTANGGR